MIKYEFLMQVRKRSLWLSAALLAVLMTVMQGDRGPRYLPADADPRVVMTGWALLFASLLPIGFGMVLADRLVRDQRLGVDRLLGSLPVPPHRFVAGKYLGSVAATALPALTAILVAATGEFANRRDPGLFLWALVAFAAIVLPGLLFVAAFALVLPMLITAPLFRVLFVGYWFWGNMLGPDFMPSLTGTLLAPIGDYAATWLGGETAFYAGADGWLGALRPEPTGAAAGLSIALLVAFALIPLAVAGPLLTRRRQAA